MATGAAALLPKKRLPAVGVVGATWAVPRPKSPPTGGGVPKGVLPKSPPAGGGVPKGVLPKSPPAGGGVPKGVLPKSPPAGGGVPKGVLPKSPPAVVSACPMEVCHGGVPASI